LDKGKAIKLSVAAVLLVAAVALIVRSFVGGNELTRVSFIEIECQQTGEVWEMERGRLMDSLYARGDTVDPEVGLSSPHANGAPVAFPKDRGAWQRMVDQVNAEREAFRKPGSKRD